jgi:hypothetical protein
MLTLGNLPVPANSRHLEIMGDGLRAIPDASPGEGKPAAGGACGQPATGRGHGKHDRPADGPRGEHHDQDTLLDAWVRELVEAAPPLTPAQRDKLALLLNTPAPAGPAARGHSGPAAPISGPQPQAS